MDILTGGTAGAGALSFFACPASALSNAPQVIPSHSRPARQSIHPSAFVHVPSQPSLKSSLHFLSLQESLQSQPISLVHLTPGHVGSSSHFFPGNWHAVGRRNAIVRRAATASTLVGIAAFFGLARRVFTASSARITNAPLGSAFFCALGI